MNLRIFACIFGLLLWSTNLSWLRAETIPFAVAAEETRNGLEFRLWTDPTAIGESQPVRIHYTVTNRRTEDVSFTLSADGNGLRALVMANDPASGTPSMWRNTHPLYTSPAQFEVHLAPGEAYHAETTWDGSLEAPDYWFPAPGAQLPPQSGAVAEPGRYTVTASLNPVGGGAPADYEPPGLSAPLEVTSNAVFPEPGSFVLALCGLAVLAGRFCLRRR